MKFGKKLILKYFYGMFYQLQSFKTIWLKSFAHIYVIPKLFKMAQAEIVFVVVCKFRTTVTLLFQIPNKRSIIFLVFVCFVVSFIRQQKRVNNWNKQYHYCRYQMSASNIPLFILLPYVK